jgi:hypothetical protein
VVHGSSYQPLYGKLWNSGWGSEEQASTSYLDQSSYDMWTAVAIGDDIHLAFNKVTSSDLIYVKRTYGVGWGAEATIQASTTNTTCPAISVNGSNLACFWLDTVKLYVKNCIAGTWDINPTTVADETSNGITSAENINAIQSAISNVFGILYDIETSAPYFTRYASYTYVSATYNLTNSPASIDFGVIQPSTTYYAYGSAPSDPVTDAQCTFTITNGQANAIKVNIQATNFTGGGGWTLGTPDGTHARLIAYTSGMHPAAYVTLTTSPQTFVASLAGSATIKWDFSFETATAFADGTQKSSSITLTGLSP